MSLFQSAWYLAKNPDVAKAVQAGWTDALTHYVQYGQNEGRVALPFFDSAYYLAQNPDVAAAVAAGHTTAFEHFNQYGQYELRSSSPWFNVADYLAANSDVAEALALSSANYQGISPLGHLLQYGLAEGRDLGNGVDLSFFAADPVFNAALQGGDAASALARVAEVTPFISTFKAPAGWTAAADTPIPLDFVPVAGETLTIPAGVKVPEGVQLPEFIINPDDNEGNTGGNTDPETPEPTLPEVGSVQTFTPNKGTSFGSSDASTAIALDDQYMVVGDDEHNILRVYDREGGDALMEWSFQDLMPVKGELDLEASTRIDNVLYFTGAHSNKKSGANDPSREFMFAVEVKGSGKDTVFTPVANATQAKLKGLIGQWDSDNGHGLGADYFGFAASGKGGVTTETVGGFSIEGMTASLDNKELLLGFRAPQADTTARDKAVIVPISVESVFSDAPVFGTPIELNLGGRGIRSIEKAADGSGYLIIAGPAGPAQAEVEHNFRLYTWDGISDDAVELDVDLDALRAETGGSFETLVEVPSIKAGTLIQLLQDNGDTVWSGKSKISKDLPAAEQQFQGNWIALGTAVADTTAPELVKAFPADGAGQVHTSSPFSFSFNEGVKLGTGAFVLKQGDQVIEQFSINSGQVQMSFNTVTLLPSNVLEAGKTYSLEMAEGAVLDHAGNAVTEQSFSFTAAVPTTYSVLISEVNSNAAGGDFFEIYNYGDSTIDLSGWKWIDDAVSFDKAVTISSGSLELKAGETIVVTVDNADAFKATWGLDESVQVIQTEEKAPGLGKADAVVLYDAGGYLVTSFNYSGNAFTLADGTVIEANLGQNGKNHAGSAAGGKDTDSAIWDGLSVENPTYIVAQTGQDGVLENAGGFGSPGSVLLKLIGADHLENEFVMA